MDLILSSVTPMNYFRVNVNVVIEKGRSTVHGVSYSFCVHYAAQKSHDIQLYIQQINKYTKHKFRRLFCYILFPVCL